jgi:SP family arabinose:H+ symporter-like MFS transporter
MSIATMTLWIVGYLGNQLFPVMQKHFDSDGTFWFYGTAALLNFICVLLLVPETKGRTLEQITKLWTVP